MEPATIKEGADIAERVFFWVVFSAKRDMTLGQLRHRIRGLFGAEVEAEIQRRYPPVGENSFMPPIDSN